MVFKAGIVILICAGLAYLFYSNPAFASTALALAEAHGVLAMAGFSLLISAVAIWRLLRVQKTLSHLQFGLDQFERHINEKIDALPRQVSREETLGTRIPLPTSLADAQNILPPKHQR